MPYKIRVQRKTGKWEDEADLIIHTGSPPRRDDVIEANLHDGKIKARETKRRFEPKKVALLSQGLMLWKSDSSNG